MRDESRTEQKASDQASAGAAQPSPLAPPSLSLPKGGGAIRGIGEKFAANPVTGTASLSIPIYTSPGRSGFGPQLALAYDSGAGNGPFGFGWTLSLPSITRKTEKGLPRYRDADESDVFILSGAEDLVPVLAEVCGQWQRAPLMRMVDGTEYCIQRYRPRVEGLFARIERWTNARTGETHWRSLSRDNITTLYGKTAESRIVDPTDPTRIFSWLICESYDDKGSAIRYEYKAENSQGIDLSRAHERNRTDLTRSVHRYLKRVHYGNRTPRQPNEDLARRRDWLFEVVFDYGEHYTEDEQGQPRAVFIEDGQRQWPVRQDPFSSHRPGFEDRTYRLCQRTLMFHHFPEELGAADYLVRATEFTYAENPIASFMTGATQSGYVQRNDGTYLKKSLPPLEFEYTNATIQAEIQEVDTASLENLPYGLDGARYQWIDLDGEGVAGILSEQAGALFYKRNLSPVSIELRHGEEVAVARFGPKELVAPQPSLADLRSGRAQFLDLAGDGLPDLVQLEGPVPGFYERTADAGWKPFAPFLSLPNVDWDSPHLRFIDLTGDGRADVLVTEDEVFTWYPSLAEEGFGPAQRVRQSFDEERGPRLVFADRLQSIYLADLSGDGLTDLVRIRNGEVCYWPNLGYGRFSAKVTMAGAPWFDEPDLFDQRRIRLADIDGSGVTDIIYLARDGVHIYFNQAGNSWREMQKLTGFPPVDNLSNVMALDLLGNGTACLVWSSPLPSEAGRPMRYVDLMGGQKPHLLIRMINNLGAETNVSYAPSTRFYLADKLAGKPWITRLPFPVHVVEQVETIDRISRNRFVTRYAYHHGYFDGVEREFRGFGMVEQQDTEEFAVLSASDALPAPTNIDAASHVPPVLTRTWFHTGAWTEGCRVSRQFEQEYYREPGLSDAKFDAQLLPDTVLRAGLSAQEQREAHRALKGAILRQETYALDDTPQSAHPYVVSERNYTIEQLQPLADNRFAIFFTHPRETIDYHYERNPADPRISHALTLEVDAFGNVLRSTAIGYGRRHADAALAPQDQAKQTQTLITATENQFTNAIELDDDYRTPLPSASHTFELTGLTSDSAWRFDFITLDTAGLNAAEIAYEAQPSGGLQKRLIEHVRTLYRRNDLDGPLPLERLESLALPFESYKLAFTPGLLPQVYEDRVTDEMLANEGGYVHSEGDDNWWIPSGRIFFSPDAKDSSAQEFNAAREHFFLPRRFLDPFGNATTVSYDEHDLLPTETRDALDNTVRSANDYRVLQPRLVTDPNGNRSAAAFDALGMMVGTAAMGKESENLGDSLDEFEPDLDEATIIAHLQDPFANPHDILKRASTRLVYDLHLYQRASATGNPQPSVVYTLARETHDADLQSGEQTKIQHSFSYSDGFGREIQKKIQAEPGPIIDGGPEVTPRWVGSGWTIFNNKGKPVQQYEPFFDDTHDFKFEKKVGVNSTLFYDPVERVVATLLPNKTWAKVVFDPWQQETWDVNDTVLLDPKTDPDVSDYFQRLLKDNDFNSWHSQRVGGALGVHEQQAAQKAAAHAATPSTAYLDSLGRTFLTVVDNGAAGKFATRVELDIEGNQREVIDALDRIVMRYDYDLLGNRIYQLSMEAGARHMLNDVTGKPIRAWDSRGHTFRTEYDELRRPAGTFVRGRDQQPPDREIQFEKTIYGDTPDNGLDEAQRLQANLRGKPYKHHDTAGLVISGAFDFKGNLLHSTRQLTRDYKNTPDWSQQPELEREVFSSSTRYDALNRPIQLIAPHSDQPDTKLNVVRPGYNDANLLERVDAWLQHPDEPAELLDPQTANLHAVTDIDYNAKGQRTLIAHGNGAQTTYGYDPLTFRLTRLLTTRDRFPAAERTVQDLQYSYDPIGNITHIQDDAQQTIFFRNQQVEPHNDYVYDAIYRLIEATGREHLGQVGNPPTAPDVLNHFHTDLDHPSDGRAMGRYRERYEYDAVGNFLAMKHAGSDPANSGWRRGYEYHEASLIEADKVSNRLSNTKINDTTERYSYDEHGNTSHMSHLPLMRWDFKDQLQATSQQVRADGGTPEVTYYVYDGGGQRVRKVTESQANPDAMPSKAKERIYLGGFEIYWEYSDQGETIKLERETLHLMDDKQRIALVETRIKGEDNSPEQLIRYQFGNHLGSASLELDDQARIVSYEEYYPFGSTSYQAEHSQIETPKRYRYTGKERDEESGFYYHGARYYEPWLGIWASADPKGLVDGSNLFAYARNNPITYSDSTGTECDPTMESCIDPTAPTLREEALQQSLPEDERYLPAASFQEPTPPTQPTAQPTGRVISPPPPVSPTDYTLYVPQGFVYTQYQTAAREAENSDNSWALRGGMFVLGTLVSPLALAEEYVARPITNIPFVVHNAGIKIGEHSARAYLWAEQGEYGEATVDVLEGVKSFSHGFVAAASVAAPIAGTLESRAVSSTTAIVEGRMASTAASGEALTFYTVQNEANAARLLAGGAPWPTGVSKSLLGEGLYTWGTRSQAEAYLALLESRGASGLQIMEARIGASQYQSLGRLDLRTLDNAALEAWMEQYSLYGQGAPHGLGHIIRQTGNFGPEYFFSKDVFNLFRF